MNLFDMRTVIFSYALSNFIAMLVMIILWRQNSRRYEGVAFWMADFILQFIAMVLLAMRGIVPNILSMTAGNAMIIGGTILILIGLELFTGMRGHRIHNYILLAVFILSHMFFVYRINSLTARNILFSVALLTICLQCSWLMLKRVNPEMLKITRNVGLVFACFCLVSLIRIIVDALVHSGNDLFSSNVFDTSLLIAYQMLFVLLSFSLFLMINQRLFVELKRDIAERKQTEKIIQLRLKLWEFAAVHTVSELMQKALDEIEILTDSLISFYHFVDEDKNSLTLQAWSTSTKKEYCKAEGEGMHYSIEQAGVWTDCIREKKPVIHNDYASLPNRKGMPEGHALLIRELVVPTFRDGRIVSILGVGNKPSNYKEKDVELVSYFADIVWTIVAHKRLDEKIHDLNKKLEYLAMTDDLTGLANRRSFFIQGNDEIKRVIRYNTPLSLIMLDIDKFKDINDTYGHEAGDALLKCITSTLKENIREIDFPARLGGEEFGILLPNTKVEDAKILAERLRLAIEKDSCFVQEKNMQVTASVGLAFYKKEMTDLDAFLRHADTAMYQAKKLGRNRIFFLD